MLQAQHELAYGNERDHVVDEVGAKIGHALAAARGAEAATLAAQRDEVIEAAGVAAKAAEALLQDAAVEEAQKRAADERRHLAAGAEARGEIVSNSTSGVGARAVPGWMDGITRGWDRVRRRMAA